MSKHRKTSRKALLFRHMRRRCLAAFVVACGMLGQGSLGHAVADDGLPKSEINLKLLPPLPVGIGQLSGSQGDSQGLGSRLRSNPYVSQDRESNDRQPAKIRQVGVVTSDAGEEIGNGQELRASLRRIKQPESTFALRPVPLPSPAQVNPLVSVASIREEAAPEKPILDAVPAISFSLSDQSANSHDGFRLRDEDEAQDTVTQNTIAPLLKVAPPPLLEVAEPLQFVSEDTVDAPATEADTQNDISLATESTEELDLGPEPDSNEAEQGDVRSSFDRVARQPLTNLKTNAFVDSDQEALPIDTRPIVIEQVPQATSEPARLPMIVVAEPVIEAAAEAPMQLSREQLPVPQVFRPKQSLVIDTKAARTSDLEAERRQVAQTSGERQDPVFDGVTTGVLEVTIAQTQTMTPTEAVRRLQLEDRDVCDVVLVGSHKLLLIGRTTGVTRLAVWCGEEAKPSLYEVHVVKERDASPGSSLDSIATRLTETIAATYPKSHVRVVPQGEGLAVIGKAGDVKSAREIMRLVRSACLKSVSDHLEVR